MQIFVINTTTLANGMSYAWDRDWDIKTPEDARREYSRLGQKLASMKAMEAQMTFMEELAAKDGFALVAPHKQNQKKQRRR